MDRWYAVLLLAVAVVMAAATRSSRSYWSRRSAAARQMLDEKVEQREDARYDAMSDVEREAYYLSPGPFTKFRKSLRGR
jgi:hypothetical protein